jgi:hypothetical protein
VQIVDAGIIRLGIHALQREHALHVANELALMAFQNIGDHGGNIINSQASVAPPDAVK